MGKKRKKNVKKKFKKEEEGLIKINNDSVSVVIAQAKKETKDKIEAEGEGKKYGIGNLKKEVENLSNNRKKETKEATNESYCNNTDNEISIQKTKSNSVHGKKKTLETSKNRSKVDEKNQKLTKLRKLFNKDEGENSYVCLSDSSLSFSSSASYSNVSSAAVRSKSCSNYFVGCIRHEHNETKGKIEKEKFQIKEKNNEQNESEKKTEDKKEEKDYCLDDLNDFLFLNDALFCESLDLSKNRKRKTTEKNDGFLDTVKIPEVEEMNLRKGDEARNLKRSFCDENRNIVLCTQENEKEERQVEEIDKQKNDYNIGNKIEGRVHMRHHLMKYFDENLNIYMTKLEIIVEELSNKSNHSKLFLLIFMNG